MITCRLWSLNRVLGWFGLGLQITSPADKRYPTLISIVWIGWGERRRASDWKTRGEASGYIPDEDADARYMRCFEAQNEAWDRAVREEFGA